MVLQQTAYLLLQFLFVASQQTAYIYSIFILLLQFLCVVRALRPAQRLAAAVRGPQKKEIKTKSGFTATFASSIHHGLHSPRARLLQATACPRLYQIKRPSAPSPYQIKRPSAPSPYQIKRPSAPSPPVAPLPAAMSQPRASLSRTAAPYSNPEYEQVHPRK
jgi:hypothetical protein